MKRLVGIWMVLLILVSSVAPVAAASTVDAPPILGPQPLLDPPDVFVNEIHYDNAGTDADEGIELAGPAGTDLTDWQLVLYNGNGGAVYDTRDLSGVVPDQQNGYGTVFYSVVGLQNGAPDGIALVYSSTQVVQFLSYEGTFTAVGGPADGLLSTDIGVDEDPPPDSGNSLQLTGTGTSYADFGWTGPISSTYDAVNSGQTFGAAGAGSFAITKSAPVVVVPGERYTYTLMITNSTGISTTGTTITDAIPAQVSFAAASDGGVQVGQVVSWTVPGWLPQGAVISRTFEVTAGMGAGVAVVNDDYGVRAANWVTWTAGSPVTTTISPLDLSLSKTGPAQVDAGAAFSYTLVVRNQTFISLTNLTVSDSLPLSLTYARSDPAGVWDPASHTVTWTAPLLADGEALTYTIVVTAPDVSAVLTNSAYAAWASNWITPTGGAPVETRVRACNTIYGIQYTDDAGSGTYPSPCLNEVVTVEGIVYASLSGRGFFVTDASGPWHGLYVYYPSGALPQVGDKVRATGTVREYYGLTELGSFPSYSLLSSGHAPYPPSVVTAAQVQFNAGSSEAYESVLVQTQDITVTAGNNTYRIWSFTDASGGTGKADDWGYDANPAVGDTMAILRGALVYDFSEYKVMPRDASDVVASNALLLEKRATSNVPVGELLTYTLTVVNNTGLLLSNLTITDALPAANATFAYALDGGILMAGEVVSWTAAALPSGASLNVRLVVTATGAAGSLISNTRYAAWAGNWPTPTLGSPVLTVVGDTTPIPMIQGASWLSPFEGQTVRTQGVVVGFFEGNFSSGGTFDGFYLQDPAGDGITGTSDALFVNHANLALSVSIGDLVTVTGEVQEFSEYDRDACPDNACLTQVAVDSAGSVVVGGTGAVATLEPNPPGDPLAAGLYWESLEGMLVSLPATATVVGPTNYGAVMVVPGDLGIDRVIRTGPYAGMSVGVRHYELYGEIGGGDPPGLIVGSVISNADGPLAFSYGGYLIATQPGDPWLVVYDQPAPATPPAWPPAAADEFSLASFNAYNLDSLGVQATKFVSTVVQLGGPTFLALQEINAAAVITGLLTDLATLGYPYDYGASYPDERGFGIVVLWRSDVVTDVTWSAAYQGCSPNGSTSAVSDPLWATCRALGEYPIFPRRPVVVTGTLSYGGLDTQAVVIGNHLKSKLGGAPSDLMRLEAGQFLGALVDQFVANGMENVLVAGDLNDFEDAPPLLALYASGNLTNTWYALPPEARYSYIYNGVSQILDHILASPSLLGRLTAISPLHLNADYPYIPYASDWDVVWRASDHDPVAATFSLAVPQMVITITEIMQNPDAVLDSDGEWFEVYNPGPGDVDINGWTIQDLGSDSHVIDNGGPLWVPAGGYVVLGRNADSATNGGVTVAYEYSGITLGNSDDEIVLLDGLGREVDRVVYSGAPPWPGPTGRSMLLCRLTGDNNVAANWAEAAYRWNPPDSDFGSPGAPNDCSALSIVKSVWPVTGLTLGDPLTYTVVVSNAGAGEPASVQVTDALPAGVVGSDLDWTGVVTAGEQVVLTIPAAITTDVAYLGRAITNTACLSHASGSDSASVVFYLPGPIVTFAYHDLEDVVYPGESVYLAGSFNGWSTTATPMAANPDHSIFTVTVPLTATGTHQYRYVVYTDTVPSGLPNPDWLQEPNYPPSGHAYNRVITVTQAAQAVHDYRAVVVDQALLVGPPTLTLELGGGGEVAGWTTVWNVTDPAGEGRGLLAELGYGNTQDPAGWTWTPLAFAGDEAGGDRFLALITPTATGVYSYVVRFDGNGGAGNPNAGWVYGDLDGTFFDGDPFELSQCGVLTVSETLLPDLAASTKSSSSPGQRVMPGGLVTYTVVLSNSGRADASALVTDVLGSYYTVYAALDWVESPTGTLTWSGVVPAGGSVSLTFVARLAGLVELPFGRTDLANGILVSDGIHAPFAVVDLTPPWVSRFGIYLPLVARG